MIINLSFLCINWYISCSDKSHNTFKLSTCYFRGLLCCAVYLKINVSQLGLVQRNILKVCSNIYHELSILFLISFLFSLLSLHHKLILCNWHLTIYDFLPFYNKTMTTVINNVINFNGAWSAGIPTQVMGAQPGVLFHQASNVHDSSDGRSIVAFKLDHFQLSCGSQCSSGAKSPAPPKDIDVGSFCVWT